jgi:FXSXX-COOH protein
VDLSGVPLERLRTLDYPDVSESLERLLGDLDDPHSVRAGGSNPSHAE